MLVNICMLPFVSACCAYQLDQLYYKFVSIIDLFLITMLSALLVDFIPVSIIHVDLNVIQVLSIPEDDVH